MDPRASGRPSTRVEAGSIPPAQVIEVRAATEIDPTTVGSPRRPQGMAGTKTLRKCAYGPSIMHKSFSLILDGRSLDVECKSELQATKLREAFKLLVAEAKASP